MIRRRTACAALLAPWLGACATRPSGDADAEASRRLRALLDASDEASLRRNPIWAIYRGDLRFAAQHGDFLSAAHFAAERRAAEEDLAALAALPREQLPAGDRVACDTFRWTREDALERFSLAATAIAVRLPVDQMTGWHVYFAVLSSGEGVAPYRDAADYDNGLARIHGFVGWLDQAIGRMREGMEHGIVQPRIVVERLVAQFERFAAQGPDDSPYFGPIRRMPATLPAPEQQRLRAAYAAMLDQALKPAFRRMQTFLVDEYRPAARASVGLSALPGGAAHYARLIRSHTTTAVSADEVHRLGLEEVERITQGMRAVQRRVGFAGTLAQFFDHVQHDPKQQPVSAAVLAEGYRAIGARVDAVLPRLIARRPKTPLEIRPTPDFQAPTDAAARYSGGAPETGRPGIFYYNTYDLPNRPMFGMETLYLHEAIPGHHLQTMLAVEATALPSLLRFDGNTAFNEGWALYAESLGPELGLFEDPYQLFGHYNDAMLRAMRLAVDSGLHAFGWTREQAIDYMLAHSAMSPVDVTAEVERYIADPGQALAYKVGELTIRRLRGRAEQVLGARFDPRAFHTQVLETGSIPLPVLEAKIEAWLAVGAA